MAETGIDAMLQALWKAMGGDDPYRLTIFDKAPEPFHQIRPKPEPPHKYWRTLWTTVDPKGFAGYGMPVYTGDCAGCRRFHRPDPYYITRHSALAGPIMPSADAAEQAALDYLSHSKWVVSDSVSMAGPVRVTPEGTPLQCP